MEPSPAGDSRGWSAVVARMVVGRWLSALAVVASVSGRMLGRRRVEQYHRRGPGRLRRRGSRRHDCLAPGRAAGGLHDRHRSSHRGERRGVRGVRVVGRHAEERGRGLMGVTDLGDAAGMVFEFDEPIVGSFYMFQTPTPLSIAWFAPGGDHVGSADMAPCLDTRRGRVPPVLTRRSSTTSLSRCSRAASTTSAWARAPDWNCSTAPKPSDARAPPVSVAATTP